VGALTTAEGMHKEGGLSWRERNRLAGRCLLCSRPAFGGTIRCKHHRDLHNAQERAARMKRRQKDASS